MERVVIMGMGALTQEYFKSEIIRLGLENKLNDIEIVYVNKNELPTNIDDLKEKIPKIEMIEWELPKKDKQRSLRMGESYNGKRRY